MSNSSHPCAGNTFVEPKPSLPQVSGLDAILQVPELMSIVESSDGPMPMQIEKH
ncbi:MAG: hypothetical protein AB8B79_16915 [Granulosicoccus sp.]